METTKERDPIRKEARLVNDSSGGVPVTVASLVLDLRALGMKSGMTVLVHSSLSSLGWVCGGPVAVVLALEEVLCPSGTLVMPAHPAELSEPSLWRNPSVPETWWETIRSQMPAFRPDLTPTRKMGAIAECFRKQEGVLRSSHPQLSFAARGPEAESITGRHGLAFSLGEDSPLARIYDLDGSVLLLEVGHSNNTSIHLAEYRASYPRKKVLKNGAPVSTPDGERRWVEFDDINLDDSDFERIGEGFRTATERVRVGVVGRSGSSQSMRQRPLVDHAVEWMQTNRSQ